MSCDMSPWRTSGAAASAGSCALGRHTHRCRARAACIAVGRHPPLPNTATAPLLGGTLPYLIRQPHRCWEAPSPT
jgi:hypothetical protein